ncbi:MAG: sodium-dependent transporter [Gammaproteobacteria bacterium]|nr:sodium-dependent transporter [Gammaproteobacteria bacterium]
MASIGFAVGLGNIWRFPYVTGENGGSAFVIVYLACAFGIGVPILMAEIMIGRHGRAAPPMAMARMAQASGASAAWSGVGYLSLLTAFSILVGYSVVAGWVLHYMFQALTGDFQHFDVLISKSHFDDLLANIPLLVFWTVIALVAAGAVIYAGVEKGIERAVKALMPLLFILLVGLAIFNVFAGGMPAALDYLFTPDFSKLDGSVLLAAVGQAFFSIGVAMAGMMMFGAYLPQHISIGKCALIIVCADTAVALLAGIVIFPMVFNNGLDPAGGVGLIFQTLPLAFANMPGGYVVAIFFFLLLSVAAITSMVGLCEPLTAWLSERFQIPRERAVVLLMLVALMVSLVSVLSYNVWVDVSLFGQSLNQLIDFVPNQLLLPVGGLLIALFAGWVVNTKTTQGELQLGIPRLFVGWHNLVRFIVVPAIFLILISGL